MSAPPAYDRSKENPDKRPLPPGWITQFNQQYNEWFYVNTHAQPPETTWTHPLGPAPPEPAPQSYAPPAGPPPTSPGYNDQKGPSFPQSPNQSQSFGYGNPQGQYQGYNSPGGYSSPPPQDYGAGSSSKDGKDGKKDLFGKLGKLMGGGGKHSGGGGFGGGQHGGYPQQAPYGYPQQGYPQQGYQQYPGGYGQQPMYVGKQKKSGGMGGMMPFAAGAAGLGAGLLIGDAIMDDHDYEQGYEQGFDDGGDFGGDF